MSTKLSIYYSDKTNVHLYDECFDDEKTHTYIEVNSNDANVNSGFDALNRVTIKIDSKTMDELAMQWCKKRNLLDKKNKLPFSEKDLVEGLNEYNAHADELAELNQSEIVDYVSSELKDTVIETKKTTKEAEYITKLEDLRKALDEGEDSGESHKSHDQIIAEIERRDKI